MLLRHIFASLALTGLLLAACTPSRPVVRPAEAPTAAVPTLPPPSTQESPAFASATYRDDANGFELDYPADWSAAPNAVLGSRGSQTQLFSPGTTAEVLAPGGSRLSLTIYGWDPKGDLGAYLAQRRLAWDASGFKVRDGSLTQLTDGRPASDFHIEPPGGALSYVLFTTLGDRYLELAGEGDLALLKSIAGTLRPLGVQY